MNPKVLNSSADIFTSTALDALTYIGHLDLGPYDHLSP